MSRAYDLNCITFDDNYNILIIIGRSDNMMCQPIHDQLKQSIYAVKGEISLFEFIEIALQFSQEYHTKLIINGKDIIYDGYIDTTVKLKYTDTVKYNATYCTIEDLIRIIKFSI